MRRFGLPLVLSVVAGVGLGLGLGAARAGDDIKDARVILDAKNGTVKKWARPPKFTVVHDRPVNRDAFAETIAFIRTATGLEIADPEYVDLAQAGLDDRFYSHSNYRLERRSKDHFDATLSIAAHNDITATSSMFIFMVAPRYASHLMVLTGYGRGSQGLERDYHRSPNHCFYNTNSDANSILFGRILISSELDMTKQAQCIYEEMVQSMGLMNDAQDSAFFTFDNLTGDKPRDYDLRLLSALYDTKVRNGDGVDKVLGIYAGVQ